jgi:hypothetical protein
MENKTNIIVFNLESNKYYLDECNNINKLFEKNIDWINKYNPISIKTIIENINIKDIDKHVRVYMHKFGINNVRGGTYKDEIINIDNIKELIWSENNCCLRCGFNSHTEINCYSKKDIYGNELEYNVSCLRCGRLGHRLFECFAKYNNEGIRLDSDSEYYTSDSEDE